MNCYTSEPSSLVAQMVKCLPTMQETWLQSLGRDDLLEKEMATHSSILAWKNPWTEEPHRLQSMGSQRKESGVQREDDMLSVSTACKPPEAVGGGHGQILPPSLRKSRPCRHRPLRPAASSSSGRECTSV